MSQRSLVRSFSFTRPRSLYSSLVALAFVAGCAAEPSDSSEDEVPAGAGDESTGGTSTTGTGGDASATGGTDTSGTGGSSNLEPDAMLPVTVSEAFIPGGFMGREGTKNETDGITMDDSACTTRAESPAGSCYLVTYQPQELDAEGSTWAGVFFQNTESNWGSEPGLVIETGATKVVFTAWAEAPMSVEFIAGGVGGLGTVYADTFKVSQVEELTTTPTQFELDLTGQDYASGVLGGFGWVIAADSLDARVFYLDDIRWVK